MYIYYIFMIYPITQFLIGNILIIRFSFLATNYLLEYIKIKNKYIGWRITCSQFYEIG